MANHIVITKLENGNVLIENSMTNDRSLQPGLDVIKERNGIDVSVLNYDTRLVYKFRPDDVEKVVREDGTQVFISDQDTLHSELFTYFFFVADTDLEQRVEDLENAFRQISYKEVIDISAVATGTIAYPAGWTLDETVIPSNAVISTIDAQDRPEYISPQDGSGNVIGVTLDAAGNWTVTGTSSQDVAIMFEIEGVQKDVINLDEDKVIDIRGNSGDMDDLTSFTLAQLNAKITDANVDDENDPRTPTAHATTHELGGTDEITGDDLRIDYTPTNYTASNDLGSHLSGIDSQLVGGVATNGIKYHLKAPDNITVNACFQYPIECDFFIDSGAAITVQADGKLIIEDGNFTLDGSLVLDGELKFKD